MLEGMGFLQVVRGGLGKVAFVAVWNGAVLAFWAGGITAAVVTVKDLL